MTVSAPTVSGPHLALNLGSIGGGFRRQRTSITEGDVVPVATGTDFTVDLGELRQRAALEWAADVMEPLRSLPPNWDSYGAEPMNTSVAGLGISLLAALALIDVAPPQAFPTADGGLSLEWHRANLDFVISLSPPDEEPPSAYFRTPSVQWEVDDILRAPDPRIDAALSALKEG
jgi:hypothetical protein